MRICQGNPNISYLSSRAFAKKTLRARFCSSISLCFVLKSLKLIGEIGGSDNDGMTNLAVKDFWKSFSSTCGFEFVMDSLFPSVFSHIISGEHFFKSNGGSEEVSGFVGWLLTYRNKLKFMGEI